LYDARALPLHCTHHTTRSTTAPFQSRAICVEDSRLVLEFPRTQAFLAWVSAA